MSRPRKIKLGPQERIMAIVPRRGYRGVIYLEILIEGRTTRSFRRESIHRDDMTRDMIVLFASCYEANNAMDAAVSAVVEESN